jgi:protein-L-isoaspartate(D-aspartate) O-methyltransferase
MSGGLERNLADREVDSLLDQIQADYRVTAIDTGLSVPDARVMQALRAVPRHLFVPTDLLPSAYFNQPLPIGHGQTISQPYIVALMTDLIQPKADSVVLEVGTGSGYQAAILGRLVKQVYSVEIIDKLAEQARQRLLGLGLTNIEVLAGNGHFGWPEHAPYDAILVAAAADRIPPALIAQLKPGGRLVMPVGGYLGGQSLMLVSKDARGLIDTRNVLPVMFVPLVAEPAVGRGADGSGTAGGQACRNP